MSRPPLDDEDVRTAAFYAELLQKFGNDVRALNWGSSDSQTTRFSVLASIGDLRGRSILDVGCGLGDLQTWLSSRNLEVDYLGIDVSPEMIGRARVLHPNSRFEAGSAMDDSYPSPGQFDYVFASGIFYLRKAEPDAFLQKAITRMFGAARIGCAFNSLMPIAGQPSDGEYRPDPVRVFEFCRSLTPWARLRADYHHGDFTMFLFRDRLSA